MAVMITGGCGFVGLNIAEALARAGRNVLLFDRHAPPAAAVRTFAALSGRVDACTGDTREVGAIEQAMRTYGVRQLCHGATITSGADREAREPESVLGVNLVGFANVLKAAHAAGLGRVVNISSASAYGTSAFGAVPLAEEAPAADPDSLYSITKFASERVGRRLSGLLGLDVRSVRLSAVFGPWELDTGVRDTLSPLMQIAQAAAQGAPALLTRGAVRDWVYSRDVAKAVIALLDAPSPHFDLYNVGPGECWPALDWGAGLRARYPNFDCRVVGDGEHPTIDLHGEADRQLLMSTRLAADLDCPIRHDLDVILADFHAWLDANPDYWSG